MFGLKFVYNENMAIKLYMEKLNVPNIDFSHRF